MGEPPTRYSQELWHPRTHWTRFETCCECIFLNCALFSRRFLQSVLLLQLQFIFISIILFTINNDCSLHWFIIILFSCLQGCSITITSLTDFLAFMIGASTVSFFFLFTYLHTYIMYLQSLTKIVGTATPRATTWAFLTSASNLRTPSSPKQCCEKGSDERYYLQTLNNIEKGEWGNKEIFSCFKLGKTVIVPTIWQ